MAKRKGVFTDEELRILLSSLVEKPTLDVADKFIQWCTRARIGNIILERILEGDLLTKVGPAGDPTCCGKRNSRQGVSEKVAQKKPHKTMVKPGVK